MCPGLQLEQSVWKTVLADGPVAVDAVQRNVAEPRLVGDETKTDYLGCL